MPRLANRVTFCLIAAIFLSSSNARAADRAPDNVLRLAIQPPAMGVTEDSFRIPSERGQQCLAIYLRDWLGATPGVLLMDQWQYSALLDDVMNPALTAHPAHTLALFTRYAPLDAEVHWSRDGAMLIVTISRSAGDKTHEFSYKGSADLPKLLGGATDWLCSELHLDPTTSPFAKDIARANPAALEKAYEVRYLQVIWNDPGTTKLKALRPFLNDVRNSGVVAGAFLRAGAEMTGRDEPTLPYIRMLCQMLPFGLGNEQEDMAIQFLNRNRHEKNLVEDALLQFVASAGKSDADKALDQLDAPEKPKELGTVIIKDNSITAAAAGETLAGNAERCDASEILNCVKVKPHLARAAKSDDAQVRAAVAFAWGQFESPAGDAELKALSGDSDAVVAFTAGSALSLRGSPVGNLADLARTALRKDSRNIPALQVLVREGAAADAPLFQSDAHDPDSARRALALEGLIHIRMVTLEESTNWLRDPDSVVVQAAIRLLPASIDEKNSAALFALANHPDWRIAESVRIRLATKLPIDPRQRRLQELATEHPYVRGQIIEALASDASPAALDDLEIATQNADGHTRALALQRLASKAPDRARRQIERMIADPHIWVRIHTAAVAAQCADASQAPCLKTALESETDEATRLYLIDALARAQGVSAPPPRPTVNKPAADRNTIFLCGHGSTAPTSVYQGYYDLTVNLDPAGKAAHDAGKIILARSKTSPNPAHVVLTHQWRDYFWQSIDKDLMPALPWLDGTVIGEETMSFGKFGEWNAGWRLFCREAGLDPLRVAGKKENLTEREQQAWWQWEQRVAIEGFNTIYDFVKLRQGKLRPGFMVCTFMPDQNGPCAFDRHWKFDIGAGYVYEASNRNRYTAIRRFKTLWPDRPVLWLVNGVRSDSRGQGEVKYTVKMPVSPLTQTNIQPYSDGVCAWLAGVYSGNFSAYLVMDKDTKFGPAASGAYLFPEETYPGSPSLTGALKLAFHGVEDLYRTKAAIKELKPDIQIGKTVPTDNATLDEPAAKTKDRFALQVEAETKRLQTGFLLDSKSAKDASRLLTDLPFPAHAHNVLLIGDMGATVGALRLPNDYDVLDSIGKIVGQELSSYRVLAIANSDQALFRDEVIANITNWLKTQNGLLYIHGSLSTSPDSKQPTPQDIEGKLTQSWPWTADVIFAEKSYQIRGSKAVALNSEAGHATLVYWHDDGLRGGVIFDSSNLPPTDLRDQINRLVTEKQIGLRFDGPIGMEAGAVDGLTAFASCRAATAPTQLKGIDLLSGLVDPTVAAGRSAAVVAQSYKGKFVATFNGVAVLADQPLDLAEPVSSGMRVRSHGLIQAAGSSGSVVLENGGPLLPIIPDDQAVDWIVYQQTPGVAVIKREAGGSVTYIRSADTVILKNGQQHN